MSNLKTYESQKSVDVYLKMNNLYKPEYTIISILPRLGEMKMLDIGVGAGRTTEHFGSLVKEYTGIDYSESLIKACKNRFIDNLEFNFKTCDVRDMQIFPDNSFDIVLFSFNGLDYISQEDRIVGLKEMHRVLNSNGYFIFSSHNLLSIKKIYQIQFTYNPFELLKRIIKYLLIVSFNGSLTKYNYKEYAILNDGAHRFGLNTFYIKPSKQIEQLNSLGFNRIQLFSLDGGKIPNSKFESIEDTWVYYYCRNFK